MQLSFKNQNLLFRTPQNGLFIRTASSFPTGMAGGRLQDLGMGLEKGPMGFFM